MGGGVEGSGQAASDVTSTLRPQHYLAARRSGFPLLFYALAVAVAAAAGGVVVGFWERHAQIFLFADEAEEILRCDDADSLQILLPRLQERWSYLTQNASSRIQMAAVYLHAADLFPRQRPYFEAARNEAVQALALCGEENVLLRLQANALAANAALAIGREREAYQALAAAENLLAAQQLPQRWRWKAMHQNNLAYLCATASEPALRDTRQALALAKALLRRPPGDGEEPASENAAFMDTLAEAYYANGDYRQALVVQRLALAMACGEDLAIYLKHYDKYAAACSQGASGAAILRLDRFLF